MRHRHRLQSQSDIGSAQRPRNSARLRGRRIHPGVDPPAGHARVQRGPGGTLAARVKPQAEGFSPKLVRGSVPRPPGGDFECLLSPGRGVHWPRRRRTPHPAFGGGTTIIRAPPWTRRPWWRASWPNTRPAGVTRKTLLDSHQKTRTCPTIRSSSPSARPPVSASAAPQGPRSHTAWAVQVPRARGLRRRTGPSGCWLGPSDAVGRPRQAATPLKGRRARAPP